MLRFLLFCFLLTLASASCMAQNENATQPDTKKEK